MLSTLTGFSLCRGVMAEMKRPVLPDARVLLSGARRVAILENIMDATNVGAIIRSAAALGMDAVLVTPGCADPLLRRAARVSMGTVFQIPWTFIGNDITDWPHPGMDRLKEMGFKTVSMALRNDSYSIDDPRLRQEEKLAILMGSEGDGLTDDTLAFCDFTVKIPMYHGVDSLNVAAASAVAFWELRAR
jgi:tRNA G18 (ribose-2'-O)-methylase SpoU